MKFYTIGYGGRNPQDFVDLLKQKGVKTIVDVRLRPDRSSMGAYVKAGAPEKGIQKLLSRAHIGYVSLVELGNIFRNYEDWRERYKRLFDRAGELLTDRLNEMETPFCMMCAEKKVANCHRQVISDYLVMKGHEVEHLE
ncbi:MAG: DUF488 domain-containing protein [Deltaproteobacteria bacterium]|nr:DUF488 domain-containing protein [Deltaproteobacteria bacterium]